MTFAEPRGASSHKASMEEGHEAEENLPLYEEFQLSEGTSNALPHVKATPMEVADFLTHLLIDSRGMSTDGAHRVAALWTRGTGQELCSFPPAMYFDIFGKEDGWIVYKEVHLALHREKSKTFSHRYGTFITLAVALCFEAIAISVVIAGVNDMTSDGVVTVAIIASLFGFMFCGAAVGILIERCMNPEERIEGTLRTALAKTEVRQ